MNPIIFVYLFAIIINLGCRKMTLIAGVCFAVELSNNIKGFPEIADQYYHALVAFISLAQIFIITTTDKKQAWFIDVIVLASLIMLSADLIDSYYYTFNFVLEDVLVYLAYAELAILIGMSYGVGTIIKPVVDAYFRTGMHSNRNKPAY